MTTSRKNQQVGSKIGTIRRSAVIVLAAALAATACGSDADPIGSESLTQSGETEAVASGDESAAETPKTEATGDGQEEPATTTSPAAQQTYEPDPLEEDGGQSLLALTLDVAGQTDDVSRELNRVAFAPTFRTPKGGAYIVDFRVDSSLETPTSPGSYGSRVTFVADGTVKDLRTFYETSFIGEGWEVTGVEEDQGPSGQRTTLGFRKEGPLTNLEIQVVDLTRFDGIGVTIRFNDFEESIDPSAAERLGLWSTDMVPADAELAESTVGTSYYGLDRDLTGTQLLLDATWAVDRSSDELIAEVQQVAIDSGREHDVNLVGVRYASTDELPATEVSASDGRITVRMVNTFENADPTTFAPSGDAGDSQSDDENAAGGPDAEETDPGATGTLTFASTSNPLVDNASADQIQAAIEKVLGPTDDVGEAMARFGHFPVLATPDNAEIVQISARIDPVILADDLLAETNKVILLVPKADRQALTTFYEAKLAEAGWKQVGRNEKTSPESTELSYSISGTEAGVVSEPLVLNITDHPDGGRVVVTYTHLLPRDEVNLDRWTGWSGSLPLLPDGELKTVGVSTFDTNQEIQINYFITYIYTTLPDDAADQVIALLPDSDYSFNPADQSGSAIGLDHPDFDEGRFTAVARSLDFEMRRVI